MELKKLLFLFLANVCLGVYSVWLIIVHFVIGIPAKPIAHSLQSVLYDKIDLLFSSATKFFLKTDNP